MTKVQTLSDIIDSMNQEIQRHHILLNDRTGIRNLFSAINRGSLETEEVLKILERERQRYKIDDPERAHLYAEAQVYLRGGRNGK